MDQLQQAREIISQVDREMCDLFLRRMEAVGQVAEYKQARGLPVFDGAREQEVLAQGAARVEDPALREHYVRFLQNNMDVSKAYQRQLLAEKGVLRMELGERSYAIRVERGCLHKAGQLLDLQRKVCIVTDSGVPADYAKALAGQCAHPVIVTLDEGEDSKTMATVTRICQLNGINRNAVLKVGKTLRVK